MLSDSFLQEIRDRNEIESVIAPYVDLKRRGRNLTGLCPFHNEKTPSFTVYPETQSFYCFGCGAGGDAITFVRKIENLDYMEAVKSLADRAGIAMPQDSYDDSLMKKRQRVFEANREAARFFHETLFKPEGAAALEYIKKRGITPHMVRHFGLGCAPDSWDALLKHMRQKGYSPQELYDANLVRRSERDGKFHYYDNFKNRLIVPIIDLHSKVIAFGGRVLDDSKPKYINTSDTLVYKKSQGVFGLNFAKANNGGTLILAEGYMDVIALHQAGFVNSVACLGTALTQEQARLLSRYAQEVILCYDSDEAGQKAAKRAISIFKQTGVKVRVAKLSGGKDPDEIIKKHGPERFRDLLTGAANDIEFRLLKEREKYDTETSDGKMQFLKGAVQVLGELNDPIAVDVYAAKLGAELGVRKEAILQQAQSIAGKRRRKKEKEAFKNLERASVSPKDPVNPERAKFVRAAKAEEALLSSLINNPDFFAKLGNRLNSDVFITEFHRRVYTALDERVREGRSIELSFLNSSFTAEEMGAIANIQSQGHIISNTLTECIDCLKVLSEEREKQNAQKKNPAEMSDEDFAALFKRDKK